jgi:hypothetical protein
MIVTSNLTASKKKMKILSVIKFSHKSLGVVETGD